MYVLRAYGTGPATDRYDETAPRTLPIRVGHARTRARNHTVPSIWGENNLARQEIPTGGSLVRLQGIDVATYRAVALAALQRRDKR